MRFIYLIAVFVVLFGVFGCSRTIEEPSVLAESNNVFFDGLCYGPFSGIQNPASGPYPTIEQINRDLKIAAGRTKKIRIYSCIGIQSKIPEICAGLGLECMVGCWISNLDSCNEQEIAALIQAIKTKRKYIQAVVVGNEVLLRGDLTEEQLIKLVERIQRETDLPVGYADVWNEWLEHPELAKEVDFLLVHIYAFWGGLPINEAAKHTVDKYAAVKAAFPDKEVIIGELGWPKNGPKQGEAVPSLDNQRRFIREFATAAAERHIPYYYFEAFDEEWKKTQEGGVGGSWGALWRPVETALPVVEKFPFTVADDMTIISHFVPSGWMGDIDQIKYEPNCQKDPYSGSSCIKIVYTGKWSGEGWAGIYWQYPENNWGDLPGYRFRGVQKLTFWVRGERGGEKCEFKVGGIDSGKKYRDSLKLQTTGVVILTKKWQQYTIPIPQKDPDTVISGFCWVTSAFNAPNGQTIYLDRIRFE